MQKAKDEAALPERTVEADQSSPFIADITPFLYGLPITYVDVGAFKGSVFDALRNSEIRLRNAHLIEPNPVAFEALQDKVAAYTKPSRIVCHNIAISDRPGTVAMRDEGSMTHVLAPSGEAGPPHDASSSIFDANAETLDDFARRCGIDHIALLKVDVEGHELAVFEGARQLLESQSVDIVYVEAGMDPDSSQQTYYRAIEDVLRGHDYRLFRLYEQMHEWVEDSPVLRRINMAFMSARFAAANPYRLAQDLFSLRRAQVQLVEKHDARIRTLKQEYESVSQAHGSEIAAIKAELVNSEREIGALVRKISDYGDKEAIFTQKIDEWKEEARKSIAEWKESEANARKLARDLNAFIRYADRLEEKYDKLVKSRSWRLTAPYRFVGSAFRKLLRRKKAKADQMPPRPVLTSAQGPGGDGK